MFSVFWMSTPRPCFAVYMAAQAFMSKSMTSVLRYTHWRCHWSVSMPSTCLAPFYQSNHHSPLCAVSSTPLYNVTQALRTRSVVFFPLFFSFFVTSQVFFHIFLLHSFCFCPTVMRGSCYYSQYFQREFFFFFVFTPLYLFLITSRMTALRSLWKRPFCVGSWFAAQNNTFNLAKHLPLTPAIRNSNPLVPV